MTALNQSAFLGKKYGEYIRGAACHMQSNGQTPVCVVTDLQGKILLGNTGSENSEWTLVKARANITRFWTASTAFFQCAVERLELDKPYPPLTKIAKVEQLPYRQYVNSDQEPRLLPLYLNDEICIYMGYIDGIRPVLPQDLIENRLLRVFVGVVDIISASGTTNAGDTILVQCRDRMKYLMDSLSTYNTADFQSQFSVSNIVTSGTDSNATNLANLKPDERVKIEDSSVVDIQRSDIILGLARRSIGHLEDSKSLVGAGGTNDISKKCETVGGFKIKRGFTNNPVDTDFGTIFTAYERTKKDNDNIFIGGSVTNSVYGLSVGAAPRTILPSSIDLTKSEVATLDQTMVFNIITGRLPYKTGEFQAFSQNFQVTDRVPIEYIKSLAQQEPWPTEVFQDHRSGEFWYGPRGLDLTGFDDASRFNRTYFYKQSYGSGDARIPHKAQMCKIVRNEVSSLNWRSNVLVSSKSGDGSGQGAFNVHLQVTPQWLENRKFACSYFFVNEPTASVETGELAIVALQFARNLVKELRVGFMEILGDPSLVPGEVVSVVGSVLNFDSDPFKKINSVTEVGPTPLLPRWRADQLNLVSSYKGLKKLAEEIQQIPKAANNANDSKQYSKDTLEIKSGVGVVSTKDVKIVASAAEVAARDMCLINSTKETDKDKAILNKITPPDDLLTVWRVEAVNHKFNDGEPGYYTEASLMPPIV